MTALAANRRTDSAAGTGNEDDAAAGVHVFHGALVSLDSSGNARPARATNTDRVRGVCIQECDNTDGSAGDLTVKTRSGIYLFFNSEGADEVTKTSFDEACYVVDDQTVAKTSDTGARPQAGRIVCLVGDMVAVQIGERMDAAGDLVASNNLSDVGSAATSRANIGADKMLIHLGRVSTKASDSGVLYAVAPRACTIVKFWSVLNNVLATADAEFQLQSAATAGALADVGSTTTGKITATSTGAAGDVDSATPLTTNLTCAEGDLIAAFVEGGSTATGTADLFVEVSY